MVRRQTSSGARVAPAIAGAVYLGAVICMAAGIALAAIGRSTPIAVILGVLLLGVGVVTCPRPYRRGRQAAGVSPGAMPQLEAALARIASALGVKPPDVIVFDRRFNASWGLEGRGQRRVLRLGVPLLAALGGREAVALLAHELAHERNGDARRGRLVGSTLAGLSSAVDLFGGQRTPLGWSRLNLVTEVSNVLLWLCSLPFRGLLWLQAHLLYRDSQRAEYLADDLAASVAGTDAVIALHDAMLARPAVETVIRRAVVTGKRGESELWDDIRAEVSEADPARRAARRERARAERRRLDRTHPTLASRIAVLESRPARAPSVELDADTQSALVAELREVMMRHTRALLDDDRARMYYG